MLRQTTDHRTIDSLILLMSAGADMMMMMTSVGGAPHPIQA